MSSERPIRLCRIKPAPPFLPEIMARINAYNEKSYQNISYEFNSVAKYYKNNSSDIARFWLSHYDYNMTDFKHILLLNNIISNVGLTDETIVTFLNNIDESILPKLDVVRVKNNTKTFYRIRIGEPT